MEDKTLHKRCTELEGRLNTRFKLYNMLAYLFVFIMFIIVTFGFFIALYPFKVLEVKQPIEIMNENKEVCAGSYLKYKIEYSKYTKHPALVSKQLVNDYIITFEDYTSNMPIGSGVVINTSSVKIPENAPSGKYKLRIVFTYQINFLSTRVVYTESEYFTVKNSMLNAEVKGKVKELLKKSDDNKKLLKLLKERQDERIAREKAQGIIK